MPVTLHYQDYYSNIFKFSKSLKDDTFVGMMSRVDLLGILVCSSKGQLILHCTVFELNPNEPSKVTMTPGSYPRKVRVSILCLCSIPIWFESFADSHRSLCRTWVPYSHQPHPYSGVKVSGRVLLATHISKHMLLLNRYQYDAPQYLRY